MRDVAEAVRPAVRAALGGVPLYPYRRIDPPEFHVQMYAGSEAPGNVFGEHAGTLYVHIYAKREEDIDATYALLSDPAGVNLDGHMEAGTGHAHAIRYRLASTNLLQEDDGTLHLAAIYTTHYVRN